MIDVREFFSRYFETYSMLTNVSNQRRIQTDIQMSKALNTTELDRLKDSRKVDSLAFVLLLFLQSFHQIDLKSTLSRDEFVHSIRSFMTISHWNSCFRWPNRKRNSDLDARKNRVCPYSFFLPFLHSFSSDLR